MKNLAFIFLSLLMSIILIACDPEENEPEPEITIDPRDEIVGIYEGIETLHDVGEVNSMPFEIDTSYFRTYEISKVDSTKIKISFIPHTIGTFEPIYNEDNIYHYFESTSNSILDYDLIIIPDSALMRIDNHYFKGMCGTFHTEDRIFEGIKTNMG